MPVHFAQFFDAGDVVAKRVFIPAIDFHSAPVRPGQDFRQDVQIAVVGRFCLFERRVTVKLRMRRGEIAAVKIQIVFLFSVIRQRAVRHLPAPDAAAVSECGQKDRVRGTAFLKNVQHLLGAFIHEGHGAGLDTNHVLACSGTGGDRDQRRSQGGHGCDCTGGGFEEFTACEVGSGGVHAAILGRTQAAGESNYPRPGPIHEGARTSLSARCRARRSGNWRTGMSAPLSARLTNSP